MSGSLVSKADNPVSVSIGPFFAHRDQTIGKQTDAAPAFEVGNPHQRLGIVILPITARRKVDASAACRQPSGDTFKIISSVPNKKIVGTLRDKIRVEPFHD